MGNAEVQGGTEGEFTQLAGELLYRFGIKDEFYVGGRYNVVTGTQFENAQTRYGYYPV